MSRLIARRDATFAGLSVFGVPLCPSVHKHLKTSPVSSLGKIVQILSVSLVYFFFLKTGWYLMSYYLTWCLCILSQRAVVCMRTRWPFEESGSKWTWPSLGTRCVSSYVRRFKRLSLTFIFSRCLPRSRKSRHLKPGVNLWRARTLLQRRQCSLTFITAAPTCRCQEVRTMIVFRRAFAKCAAFCPELIRRADLRQRGSASSQPNASVNRCARMSYWMLLFTELLHASSKNRNSRITWWIGLLRRHLDDV